MGGWGVSSYNDLNYCTPRRGHRFGQIKALNDKRNLWIKSCRRCPLSIVIEWNVVDGKIKENVVSGKQMVEISEAKSVEKDGK